MVKKEVGGEAFENRLIKQKLESRSGKKNKIKNLQSSRIFDQCSAESKSRNISQRMAWKRLFT